MQHNYTSFLEYRATQRQLVAKFARPWLLLVHVVAFIVVMTGVWVYGGGWGLWFYRDNFLFPVLVGTAWSLLLAGHALVHYQRSAGKNTQREQAVEDEMRTYISRHRDALDSSTLFEMHRALEARLEGQGRWSVALTAFAVVNALSWAISSLNIGSSWPFQMTPIFAGVIIGGAQAYLVWQQQRAAGRSTWYTRLPLLHVFAYGVATVILGLLGAMRAVNPWDVNTLVGWGLVLLLAYSVWRVAVEPVVAWVTGRTRAEQVTKRKPEHALAVGDDGELVELSDAPGDSELADEDEVEREIARRRAASRR